MELFPQSSQEGVLTDDHENKRDIISISTDEEEEEESISQGLVVLSDDGKEEGDSGVGRSNPPLITRRRWTLSEDCKLVELIASHCRQKFVWKRIAAGLPQRSSNSCRLRWTKLCKTESTFTDNRWSEMGMLMGDHVMNQWCRMIAQNLPHFYAFISPDHPLKILYQQNECRAMIICPSIGVADNGVRDTSVASSPPRLDLSLTLATGQNQNWCHHCCGAII